MGEREEWTLQTRNRHLADENQSLRQEIARLKNLNGHQGQSPISEPEILRSFTGAEFLQLTLPPREMIVAPWLEQKGSVLLYSKRGVGKTFFALAVAYAIAAAAPVLGFEVPGPPRKVLYIDGEMPAVTMQKRFAATVAGTTKQPPDPSFFRIMSADTTMLGFPALGTTEGQAAFDTVIGDAEVIVLDNLASLLRDGRENEPEGWLPVQGWALAHRRAGRAIVFVHHAGKGGQQRGWSGREDLLDTVICLRHPTDYSEDQGARFEVHFEKHRGFRGERALAFEGKYEERGGAAVWSRRSIADVEMQRVASLLVDGVSIRDIAEELGMSKSAVARLKGKIEATGKRQ